MIKELVVDPEDKVDTRVFGTTYQCGEREKGLEDTK
jgi:hypothetical protein